MDSTNPFPSPRPADPRGGMTSNPAFEVNALMDGPQVRDGNTSALHAPFWPANEDC